MILAETLLISLERAAHQRFRLREPIGGPEQDSRVIEADGNFWMVLGAVLLTAAQFAL